ncbi:MAG: hypothetical protein WAR24_20290, partial [Candidatus Acidiferrales bacterium]
LPLRSIFDFPTVVELSAKVEELIRAKIEAMSPEEVQQALSQPEMGELVSDIRGANLVNRRSTQAAS